MGYVKNTHELRLYPWNTPHTFFWGASVGPAPLVLSIIQDRHIVSIVRRSPSLPLLSPFLHALALPVPPSFCPSLYQ